MEVICGIYCIENLINNKKYIGQSIDVYRRWQDHKHGLIYCIELNMVFDNPSQVEREKVASRTCVTRCLKGERKSAGKHPTTGKPLHWKYIENNNT